MTAQTIIRGRACAIIRQADRILLNRFGGDSFWALPGGAIELGEFSTNALVREMVEELGIAIAVGRLVWVIENLFELSRHPLHRVRFLLRGGLAGGNGAGRGRVRGA